MLENDSKEDAQMKTTKRSMLVSGLCLLLTAVMLMGSTFAWFTDSVTNEGNVITAGNLSIDAYAYDVGTGGTTVTIQGVNGSQPITFEADGQDLKTVTTPILNGEIDWEPGMSDAKLLTVTNSGSLAANIRLSFAVTDGGLQDALWFDFVRVDENGNVQGRFEKRPMSTLNQLAEAMVMTLKPDETLRFVLVYGMYESAGNQFQAKTFSADVTILATQAPVEADGFGNTDYDDIAYVSDEAQLQEAVAKGGNIVLQEDIQLTEAMTVEEGNTVVLDLNGKSICAVPEFSARLFTNYGNLTIQGNGTVDVTAAGANGYGTVNNYGTLTVVGGTYSNAKESNASNFYNRNGGTATFIDATIYGGGGCIATEVNTTTEIHGGYYEDSTYPAIENRGNMLITAGEFVNTSCSSCDGRWGYTIRSGESKAAKDAYLKIQGEAEDSVKVTGVQGGLAVIGGTAEIYNGVYETTACKVHTNGGSSYYAGYFTGESYETATTIYGGTFRSYSKNAVQVGNGNPAPDSGEGEESTLIVKGGTFIGGDGNKTAITVELEDYAIGAARIYAGSFSSDPKDFLADGYIATPSGDMWVVTAE